MLWLATQLMYRFGNPPIVIVTDRTQLDEQIHETFKACGFPDPIPVRIGELPLLNRQLARFNYNTLGDLVRGVIAGKITQVTEDEQIEIMKTNLQTSGQLT